MYQTKLIQGLTATLLTAGAIVAAIQPSNAGRASGEFFCGSDKGTPATLVNHPNRGELVFIRWIRDFAPGSEWTPQKRCEKVSQKFKQNQENGSLNYIVPGRANVPDPAANGLPVLCASEKITRETISCSSEQILMTLRSGDNAQAMIKKIVEINTNRANGPLEHAASILQSLPGSSVQAINVNVMTLYLNPAVESNSGGNCERGAIGICQ